VEDWGSWVHVYNSVTCAQYLENMNNWFEDRLGVFRNNGL
jgi:hypothetical protein